jgi:hypothetical protein
MYCVAYEEWDRRRKMWIPNMEYMHATDANDSILHLGGAFRGRYGRLLSKQVRIVGVAPVVGAFAQDEHADKLIL